MLQLIVATITVTVATVCGAFLGWVGDHMRVASDITHTGIESGTMAIGAMGGAVVGVLVAAWRYLTGSGRPDELN